MKSLLAEFLGTFALVFVGTGAIIVDQSSGGAIGQVGIALVFGLIVLSMIHTFGDVSGAHLNPAVTLGFAIADRFPWKNLPGYMVAQFAGAFAASGILKCLFPQNASLGSTLPSGSTSQSFLLEILLTLILMLVILSVSDRSKERNPNAAIAIGAVVGLEALFAGPISGASMNPTRSLAPAFVSGNFHLWWLYPLAALLGAALAVPLCICTRERGCCRPRRRLSNP